MARIQYNPSARSRGFNAPQLSTAGINRMREESNRIIQNMQERRRAENEQRAKNLQAMKEDAAYQERRMKENNAIAMQNLKNEGMQQIADAQAGAKQAAIDAEAVQSMLGTLANFSGKAASILKQQELAKRKEAEEAEIAQGLASMSLEYSPGQMTRMLAEDTRDQGAIYLGTNINVNGAERNEDVVDTKKNHSANVAFSGAAMDAVLNRDMPRNYVTLLDKRLNTTDKIFTAEDGRKFSGTDAKKDRYLTGQLGLITKKDILKIHGINDVSRVAKGLGKIDQINENYFNRARKEEADLLDASVEQRAGNRESGGTTRDFEMAFQDRRLYFDASYAHEKFQELASSDLEVDIEEFRNADLKGNGNTYDKEFPKRWAKIEKARNAAFVKQQKLKDDFKKAEDREWVNANIDSISKAYEQNPNQAAMLIRQRYHGKAMTVPPVISRIEAAAMERNKDLMTYQVQERTRFGILDLSFVNSIRDPSLQKNARKAFESQEERKYGPESLGIKKGFRATARALTEINPNEKQGNAQTYLVQARLESEYMKALKLTNDPLKALENVNKLVDAAKNGDKSSPFYIDPGLGDNNRPVFPNIETSDREVSEMNTYIDKQVAKSGLAVVEKAFALADSNQMDAAYTSSLSGVVQYPPGILKVAEQFNLKPSEVFNAHRQANNAATGENKPLLTPSPASTLLDNVSPEMRKLFLSDEPAKINRGSAMLTGQLPRRASMGGRSFNPASVPNNYGEPIAAAAERNNIPPDILAGLIATESNFNSKAVSSAGAQGLAQFMPPTAAEFGVDVNDPMSSIDGAARYLRYLLDYFNGDMNLAIYAYNGGMGNIERYGGPIPGNRENEEYLQKVLDNSTKYR